MAYFDESAIVGSGLGDIGTRPLGRAGLEGAPPRVTIKERCTTAGDNKGRSHFGRSSDCGWLFWKVI